MIFYTYVYFDRIRNEPFYVGKGKEKRAWDHLKRKDHHPLRYRIQKMLREGNQPEIRLVLQNVTAQQAIDEEIRLIALYGRRDLKTGCLLNMTDGGDGNNNFSPETRAKIGLKNTGRKKTPEELEKLRIGSTGRIKSASEIAKLKASLKGLPCLMKGKKHTAQARANMSEGAKKREKRDALSKQARIRMMVATVTRYAYQNYANFEFVVDKKGFYRFCPGKKAPTDY